MATNDYYLPQWQMFNNGWTTASSTNVRIYPTEWNTLPDAPPRAENDDALLSDIEWLHAEVAEICEMAFA